MNTSRIAWLLPSMGTNKRQGYPWHSVLSELTKLFPDMTIFTGEWPGFAEGFEDSFKVQVVGKFKYIATSTQKKGYSSGFSPLSPKIIGHLIELNPKVIFTSAFSLWTLCAVFLKPIFRWQIVIVYEGSSPGVDYQNSGLRLWSRKLIANWADAFITNNNAGKKYLTEVLGAKQERVFARPFEIATPRLLLASYGNIPGKELQLQRPIFITAGQLIPRKGINLLLKACALLQQQGISDYTLLIAGDGEQRQELEALSQQYQIENCVKWLGWVEYSDLGAYFQSADVFVFPTLEDTWGLVTLEAMALGKPVICSEHAGTSEMVVEGENGYIINPERPEELAETMLRFIEQSDLIKNMGQKSQQIMEPHTPKTVSKFLAETVEFVLAKKP
ncbi:MAG: glycosyltransferase family 4 protein [Waterburya sp.]